MVFARKRPGRLPSSNTGRGNSAHGGGGNGREAARLATSYAPALTLKPTSFVRFEQMRGGELRFEDFFVFVHMVIHPLGSLAPALVNLPSNQADFVTTFASKHQVQ